MYIFFILFAAFSGALFSFCVFLLCSARSCTLHYPHPPQLNALLVCISSLTFLILFILLFLYTESTIFMVCLIPICSLFLCIHVQISMHSYAYINNFQVLPLFICMIYCIYIFFFTTYALLLLFLHCSLLCIYSDVSMVCPSLYFLLVIFL